MKSDSENSYDSDYFEKGLVTGKSCYLNYRWLPELTLKMAHYYVKYLKLTDNDLVLDLGCAKGYLVKALRIFDIPAYGCDISRYAISSVDADVRAYCELVSQQSNCIPFDLQFKWIISKDVLEHLQEDEIDAVLSQAHDKTELMFHVIPLGTEEGRYIVPEYEKDSTHAVAHTQDWWQAKFSEHGWTVSSFAFKLRGIKDNWTERYDRGNGFFFLRGNARDCRKAQPSVSCL